MNLRILITGGLGLVGGRLANHLLQEGHQVVIGSRKTTEPPALLSQAKVDKIEYDDQAALENHCYGIDVIIHAAGMNAQACIDNPEAALSFNGEMTARLVTAANRAGVLRFIYLSTAHVYTSPLVGIITELTPTKNLHPYATSNLLGENAVIDKCKFGKTQGIVLRLSNAFGAPIYKDVNCWALLINDLCKQAIQTRKLVLRTSGLEERDFIGLSNVCHGIEYFVLAQSKAKQVGIFNMGSGVSHTVLEIASLIQHRCAEVLGFKPELKPSKKGSNKRKTKLKFNTDKITSLGVDLSSIEITEEIDNLLRYCYSTFDEIESSDK